MAFEEFPWPDTFGLAYGGHSLLQKAFPLGFTKPPGGEIGSQQHALNWHAYCCALFVG